MLSGIRGEIWERFVAKRDHDALHASTGGALDSSKRVLKHQALGHVHIVVKAASTNLQKQSGQSSPSQ